MGIAGDPIHLAAGYPFRPWGLWYFSPAPVSRGSSTASTPQGWPSVAGRGAATPSDSRTSWRHILAGVDQRNKQVAHLGPVQRPVEQRILAVMEMFP
jgi:hypothetical protein